MYICMYIWKEPGVWDALPNAASPDPPPSLRIVLCTSPMVRFLVAGITLPLVRAPGSPLQHAFQIPQHKMNMVIDKQTKVDMNMK